MPQALISIFKIEFWVVTAIRTAAPIAATQGKHKHVGEVPQTALLVKVELDLVQEALQGEGSMTP